MPDGRMIRMPGFNPRSRAGSDLVFHLLDDLVSEFQSTLPRGERPQQPSVTTFVRRFQSTLPRGERQKLLLSYVFAWQFQSTLPRGERHSRVSVVERWQEVSIHAPARGATQLREVMLDGAQVSIHAPARGATRASCRRRFKSCCFNPRSRAGSDRRRTVRRAKRTWFQSTLPRGERPMVRPPLRLRSVFQSTLPRGERPTIPLDS